MTSIAELMLQDTDTNVFEERNVELPQTTVFNIRGKEKKVLSKKERQITDMKRRQAVQRELLKKKEKEKEEIIKEAAPIMLNHTKRKVTQAINDMLFVRQNIESVEINLKEDLDDEGAGGLDDYFK